MDRMLVTKPAECEVLTGSGISFAWLQATPPAGRGQGGEGRRGNLHLTTRVAAIPQPAAAAVEVGHQSALSDDPD